MKKDVPRILAFGLRHLSHRLTNEIGIPSISGLANDHLAPVMPDVAIPVFPTSGRLHLFTNLGSHSRILQLGYQSLMAFTGVPRMNESRDAQAIVDVRINVRRDLLAGGPGRFDFGDRELHLAPVLPSR